MILIIIPPRMARTISQLIEPNSTSKTKYRQNEHYKKLSVYHTFFNNGIVIEISWIWKLTITVKAFSVEKISRLDSGFDTIEKCPAKIRMISRCHRFQIFEPFFLEFHHIHFQNAWNVKVKPDPHWSTVPETSDLNLSTLELKSWKPRTEPVPGPGTDLVHAKISWYKQSTWILIICLSINVMFLWKAVNFPAGYPINILKYLFLLGSKCNWYHYLSSNW